MLLSSPPAAQTKWPRLDLHVVERAPAAVGVPRAQALPAGRVLLAGLHGHPGHLQRKQTHGFKCSSPRSKTRAAPGPASPVSQVTQRQCTNFNEFVPTSMQKSAKNRKYWGPSLEVTPSLRRSHAMNHGHSRAPAGSPDGFPPPAPVCQKPSRPPCPAVLPWRKQHPLLPDLQFAILRLPRGKLLQEEKLAGKKIHWDFAGWQLPTWVFHYLNSPWPPRALPALAWTWPPQA